MESGFESKISEQKTALAEKESKLAQVSKETSSLADKSAALESKLEESNKVLLKKCFFSRMADL